MTEESAVHTAPRQAERRVTIPRGWIILCLALASWGVVAMLCVGVWHVLGR